MYIFTNVLKLMMVYVFLRYWIYARDYYFSCEKKNYLYASVCTQANKRKLKTIIVSKETVVLIRRQISKTPSYLST